jgi:Flp pilus assembly protein TadD
MRGMWRMNRRARPAGLKIAHRLLACSLLGLALSGCKTAGPQAASYTGSISSTAVINASDLSPEQALAAVQRWGTAYSRDEKDKVAALNYAAALRAAGETSQAVAVMRKAVIYHPTDREVLAAFGKALAADGRFQEALATVRRAQRSDNPDWQLLATEGGILDSVQKHDDARDLYRQALVLAPGEPQILNNLGMSYVLTGELTKAEETLQLAAASPNATLKVRQNLALVLELRGKHDEAAQITGAPAATSAAVQAQDAIPEQDTWEELSESG